MRGRPWVVWRGHRRGRVHDWRIRGSIAVRPPRLGGRRGLAIISTVVGVVSAVCLAPAGPVGALAMAGWGRGGLHCGAVSSWQRFPLVAQVGLVYGRGFVGALRPPGPDVVRPQRSSCSTWVSSCGGGRVAVPAGFGSVAHVTPLVSNPPSSASVLRWAPGGPRRGKLPGLASRVGCSRRADPSGKRVRGWGPR